MQLLDVHTWCMLTAFGVLLPIGAFLAYTGHHRFHVYIQSTGIVLAFVGMCVIIMQVEQWGAAHFARAHSSIGLSILLLALILQPLAISKKWYAVHHKNGAAIILGGLMNIVLGMSARRYGPDRYVMYACWVGVLLILVVFDPMGTRSRRMIAMAQMKQRGESVVVDVARLFARPAPARKLNLGSSLRGRFRSQVAAGAGGAAEAGGDADADASLSSTVHSAGVMEQRWDCFIHSGGHRVELRMPGKERDFTVAGFSLQQSRRRTSTSSTSEGQGHAQRQQEQQQQADRNGDTAASTVMTDL